MNEEEEVEETVIEIAVGRVLSQEEKDKLEKELERVIDRLGDIRISFDFYERRI